MTKTVFNIFINKLLSNKKFWKNLIFIWALLFCFDALADGSDDEYEKACLSEEFTQKYDNAECWSCSVVLSLMQSMTAAAGTLYGAIQSISLIVLLYCGAICVACYFLKSLGSFATQDPARILDGLFAFMFKWALAYIMVYSGLDTIVSFIVDPLLDVGYTVGQSLSANSGIGG